MRADKSRSTKLSCSIVAACALTMLSTASLHAIPLGISHAAFNIPSPSAMAPGSWLQLFCRDGADDCHARASDTVEFSDDRAIEQMDVNRSAKRSTEDDQKASVYIDAVCDLATPQ